MTDTGDLQIDRLDNNLKEIREVIHPSHLWLNFSEQVLDPLGE